VNSAIKYANGEVNIIGKVDIFEEGQKNKEKKAD